MTIEKGTGDMQIVTQAEQASVLKAAPYEPTSAMLIAARELDPALPADAIRAIWWAMWRTAPQAKPVDMPPGFIKPDTDTHIYFYEQDFYVLSNFSAFNLKWEGHVFPTSEHAYHWEKFEGSDAPYSIRYGIRHAASAHEAFKLAEKHKEHRRSNWDDVKVGTMRGILRAKAEQHEYVRRKLLATGDRLLVEDSWRDDFWGWGANRDGKNMLGKLWMEVRAEIRAAANATGASA